LGRAQQLLRRAEDRAGEAAYAILLDEATLQSAALVKAWGEVWHFE
jgi:hypothetical protein